MIQPFLYKWTEISTRKWYIGSRSAKKCHPNDGYICSSKIVRPLIIANPSDWRREILCIGPHQYIRDLEVKYLQLLDAMHDSMSYNQCNGGKDFVNKGHPHTQETKDKIKKANKGRLSKQKGIPTGRVSSSCFKPGHIPHQAGKKCEAISKGLKEAGIIPPSQKGVKRSDETREKIREIKLNQCNGMYCGNISRLSDKKELTKKQYRQYITRHDSRKLRDK